MRIVYYTYGTITRGSARLRAFLPGRELVKLGHEVVFNPPRCVRTDVVVFQKRKDLAGLMTVYRDSGARVIMDISDYGRYPAHCAHTTVVGTTQLKTWYPGAVVVPDVLDLSDGHPTKQGHSDVLGRVVWFGTGENIVQATVAAKACERAGLALTLVSNHRGQTAVRIRGTSRVNWALDTVDAELVRHDLVICPFLLHPKDIRRSPRSRDYLISKSLNRPLKAWALGLPVIGSHVTAYVECGMPCLATTASEWDAALAAMRPRAAREANVAWGSGLIADYKLDVVTARWLDVFNGRAVGT